MAALIGLADALDAPLEPALVQPRASFPAEPGKLTPASVAALLAELMPEDCIVSDEAATAGLAIFGMTAGARRHDWLMLTGGAIGQGLPLAVGAAVACPERKVLALQADGGGMYTLQALWTMARERLDVTTVILNNGSYAILNIELMRVGVQNPGPKALSMLDLRNPALNWAQMSEGMGVPAVRAETSEQFRDALAEALAHKGPRLIEALI
jgi:acetolactate synthase-1/2/3 large subunit